MAVGRQVEGLRSRSRCRRPSPCTSPVSLSITTTEAVGAIAGERALSDSCAAFCMSRSSALWIWRPPPKALAGAVEVDQLLAQPGGEVGGRESSRRRLDVGGGRDGRAGSPSLYSVLGDVALVQHVLQHQVAASVARPAGSPAGEKAEGEAMIPASIAASWGVST